MSEVITSLRPIASVVIPALSIIAIIGLRDRPDLRELCTVIASILGFLVVLSMVSSVISGRIYTTILGFIVSDIKFGLRVDPLGLLFGLLASGLWVITSIYSIGYVRKLSLHSQTRYFAGFAGSISATIGVAFASNLFSLYIFYELLTISTYPLVVHKETDNARKAGRKYLVYTFSGGIAILAGTILLHLVTGKTGFSGTIAILSDTDPIVARLIFGLLVSGFGVKAALMPLHSWLPDAMVAPTPVSGLLHAVAVVKSGIFGITRVVLDIYGVDPMKQLGIGLPLASIALFTIIVASIIALYQDNLKRRLAYSTISQLSYIILGLGVLSPMSIVGGLLHIPAHAFMKLTLFFCAGAIHVETHTEKISRMNGIGDRMPLTMMAFAVASTGMAGIPLVAGFVSKLYLLIGTVNQGYTVFTVGLLLSGVLNIAYFWPIVYRAFFKEKTDPNKKPLTKQKLTGEKEKKKILYGYISNRKWKERNWFGEESSWFILAPILISVLSAVLLGIIPRQMLFLKIIEKILDITLMVL